MNLKALALLVSTTLVTGPALAACGAAFDGSWDLGPISAQGQHTSAMFINNSKNGVVHTQTETGTRLSSGGVILGVILDIEYGTSYKNLAAKRLDANTCVLSFRKAKVNKDTYGVNRRSNISRQATLKRSGSTIRWCWTEAGHQLGTCQTYRRH